MRGARGIEHTFRIRFTPVFIFFPSRLECTLTDGMRSKFVVSLRRFVPVILYHINKISKTLEIKVTCKTCPSLHAIKPLDGSLCHSLEPHTVQRRRITPPSHVHQQNLLANDESIIIGGPPSGIGHYGICVSVLSFRVTVTNPTFRWTKEDHEIFDLVSAVEESEGVQTMLSHDQIH
jgi:hypothetical protein